MFHSQKVFDRLVSCIVIFYVLHVFIGVVISLLFDFDVWCFSTYGCIKALINHLLRQADSAGQRKAYCYARVPAK